MLSKFLGIQQQAGLELVNEGYLWHIWIGRPKTDEVLRMTDETYLPKVNSPEDLTFFLYSNIGRHMECENVSRAGCAHNWVMVQEQQNGESLPRPLWRVSSFCRWDGRACLTVLWVLHHSKLYGRMAEKATVEENRINLNYSCAWSDAFQQLVMVDPVQRPSLRSRYCGLSSWSMTVS